MTEPLTSREARDRTETIIERALNCHWITVTDRAQFQATLRIALDTEVAAGGPYLNNGWNLGPAQDTVRAAAERVCWFDWSDNDMDAVAAIDALRKAITSPVSSTDQREGGK